MLPGSMRFEQSVLSQHEQGVGAEFAAKVKAGLEARPRHLPYRYTLDAEGARLLEIWHARPEYYLARAESSILTTHASEIAAQLEPAVTLIDLDSGNVGGTRLLIGALLRRQLWLQYAPVGISPLALEESALSLEGDFPSLEVDCMLADYTRDERWMDVQAEGSRLYLWLGSRMGLLTPPEAIDLLRRARAHMDARDRLLVGVDLRKSEAILLAAYNDAGGAAASVNLNLLARINRELGGRFDGNLFRHRATWSEREGHVDLYLDSTCNQRVRMDGLNLFVDLRAGEAIHTARAHKYSRPEIRALVREAGFELAGQWVDRQGLFTDNLLIPASMPH